MFLKGEGMTIKKNKCQEFIKKISQKKIDPPSLVDSFSCKKLIEDIFLSYNAGRLREACRIFTDKMLAQDCVVGRDSRPGQRSRLGPPYPPRGP